MMILKENMTGNLFGLGGKTDSPNYRDYLKMYFIPESILIHIN